jgi:UDP-3-O-[3-hydroxymyristoyl] glucosamine N-acyltransferase
MVVFLEDERFLKDHLVTPAVSCVITTAALARHLDAVPGLAVCDEPRRCFFELHNHLALNTDFYWHDFSTVIDPTAKVHPRAFVAERNVRIGANTVIEPNVTIMERSLIGASVIIRAGVVLGSAGFQTARCNAGLLDMVHAGGIHVHDRVEMLSNAVIAAAVFRQFTTIGESARIGNVAFVSHNAQVGARCFIGHGSVLNGNVRLGEDVWIGPGATISNNVTIGDGAKVSLGATVVGNVPAGMRVSGQFAVEHAKALHHMETLLTCCFGPGTNILPDLLQTDEKGSRNA